MRETIDQLRKETETTLRVFYAFRQFQLMLTSESDVQKINTNVHFWTVYESSMRTNMFIGLRRLYEAKPGTFNFQKFIDECIRNLGDFSNTELRKRKCEASSNANEWIEDYMKDAYEPTEDDFKALARLVRENSKNIKGAYLVAANKIYAHAIHADQSFISEISEKLNFGEIERALVSIWHAYEQVWQLYENGKPPSFNISEYPYVQEVIDSVTDAVR